MVKACVNMIGYLLIWGSVGVITSALGTSVNFNTSVKIGRCRAQCLETFVNQDQDLDAVSDTSCRNVPDCNFCWTMCASLFTSYNLYGTVCDKKLCRPGCVTACKFRSRPTPETKKHKWKFHDEIRYDSDSELTHLSWTSPVPPSLSQDGQLVVYIIMVRGKHSGSKWKEVVQTASKKIKVETNEIPNPPEFQLVAVTNKGVVANSTIIPDSIVVETILPKTSSLSTSPVATYTPDVGPLNISLAMDMIGKELEVKLIWKHPSRGVLECAKTEDYCFYNIDWFMNDCEAYSNSPRCPFSPYHNAQTTNFYYRDKPNFTLPGILFNSDYSIKITIADLHNDKIQGSLQFKTPLCLETDTDKTGQPLCHDGRDTFIKNNPVIGEAGSPSNVTVMPDLVQTTENDIPQLVVLKINSKPQMTFDPSTSKMNVNVTWWTDLNQSVFEKYTVMWMISEELYKQPETEVTKKTNIVLKLNTDTNYTIRVSATYRDDNLNKIEWEDSIIIFTETPPPTPKPLKHDLSTLSGFIVAVVVATILIIIGFVVLFYKKRKSFKDIIITKTFVTKSNSYKSNVGAGKSNYSNQLMVITDEWELDPKMLKFSTPLGQGAFGKVVTGYCSDRKVAIKLVKEGAPLSYKEDLVAEINLMKRIGSNPNIVSMIGACTLNEPIALVMEFVPHGNLQNFLKKCRMEGDLRKRSDGISEIAYSMVHDSGGIENYLITPADMLSFARQVAMAMEYLTDRRYVHRDLAARNILLGHNKVVKLCDFGLSRDIYNDNQYQKLTNGKLPLKWMAIESLRDRVFTTQSDVWSFGVLLWEIVTMGASPYPHIALSDLYYVLVNGYRMEKTSNCSDELYAIMLHCWAALPQDRPCFTQLRMMLEELLEQDRDYLVLENINVPLNTSENSSSPSSIDDMSTQQSGTSSGILVTPLTKDELRVNVCIHEKSTDRLLRKSESDSSP